MFNKIGIFGKYSGIQSWDLIDKLILYFQKKKKTVILDQRSCADFPIERYGIERLERDALMKEIDFAVVVGGDGTFLDVARCIVDYNIPILGVNLGRLGFLADVSPDTMMVTLDEVLADDYTCEERTLLHVLIKKDGETLFDEVAFNDVVLHKNDSPRMIEFETFVDNRFLNSQRSDGLIIATPTGSTAYSLSAGGPIVDPGLNAMTLVSINPHTMSNRPVVVSGDSEILIRPHDNCSGTASIICDGQLTFQIEAKHETYVTRHPNFIKMVHPKNHDHYELLRAKLNWGQKL
ncbi:MAG: NAD(+) kinase [Hydrogenovibrio crunogenus]|uniref:NAD kinase n=1 Tax=Hydrogenovibrio crunogenus (strain DSM 25203 / XCL-2) TaxID=317025 RepID=NADK_HYDCU|nr:RecName: Full=NAD kinase; AltName: Full=ATP-dependent NAD kinase [Hydrogenovibrio crunogenus XCL-2]MBD3611957.1 NAD(+) kinase [Hydrogenovibrio crunogenus]